jgi:hypothetical protein
MFRGKLSIPSSRIKRVKQSKQQFPPKWRYLSTWCHTPRASHLKCTFLSIGRIRTDTLHVSCLWQQSLSLLSTGRLVPIFAQRTTRFSFGYQEQSLVLYVLLYLQQSLLPVHFTTMYTQHRTQKIDVFLFEQLLHWQSSGLSSPLFFMQMVVGRSFKTQLSK